MSSTHTDLAAREPLDVHKALEDHERLHERLHAADAAFDAAEYEQVGKEIDEQLAAFARKLGTEGVIRLFHFTCELIGDATSPRTPHDLHLDADGLERVKRQIEFTVAHLPES